MSLSLDWRSQAVAWRATGLSQQETAERVGRCSRTIRRLEAEIRQDGLDALKARHARGRRPKLTNLTEKLLEILREAGPPYSRPDWRALADEVKLRWGITYHPGSLCRVLNPLLASLFPQPEPSERRSLAERFSLARVGLSSATESPAENGICDREAESYYAMSRFDESEALYRRRLNDAQAGPAFRSYSLWGISRNRLAKGDSELAVEYADSAVNLILQYFFDSRPLAEVLRQARSQPDWAKKNHIDILYEAMHLGAKARMFSVGYRTDPLAMKRLDEAVIKLNNSRMIAYDDPKFGYTNLWLAMIQSEQRPDANAAEQSIAAVDEGMFESVDGIAHFLRTLGIKWWYLKDNRRKAKRLFEDAAALFAEFPDARGLGLTFHNLERVAPSDREALRYRLSSFVVHPQDKVRRELSKYWNDADFRVAAEDLRANKEQWAKCVHKVMRGLENGDIDRAEQRISANIAAIGKVCP